MKISIMLGCMFGLPMMLYNLLRFIEPALPIKIKPKQMIAVIIGSSVLAIGGAVFGYYVMLPMSLHFFAGYSSNQVKPLITANEYFSYVMANLVVFALVFQIPLLFLFINRIKPLKPRRLLHYQKFVIVGAFAFALILPFTYDPVSQFIVAIPIVVLFYLSIIFVWIANLKTRKSKPKIQPVASSKRLKISNEPILSYMPSIAQPALRTTPALSTYLSGARKDLQVKAPVFNQSMVQSNATQNDKLKVRNQPVTPAKHRQFSIDGVTPLMGLS